MSEKSLAMMPWFPRDFIAATRAMRLAERGAYRELLDYQWEMGKLPKDHDRLARLLGITLDEFAELWPAIQDKFVERDGSLVNKRLEEHRDKALAQRDKKRAAAAETNAKRYAQRDGERDAKRAQTASLSDTHSASPPSPSPSPTEEEDSPLRGAPVAGATAPKPNGLDRGLEQQIIGAYHELLPALPAVKVWNAQRHRLLSDRIRERERAGKPARTVEYWRQLFAKVAASDFLCGRAKPEWRAQGLEWLLKPKNFTKLIEGAYDNRG